MQVHANRTKYSDKEWKDTVVVRAPSVESTAVCSCLGVESADFCCLCCGAPQDDPNTDSNRISFYDAEKVHGHWEELLYRHTTTAATASGGSCDRSIPDSTPRPTFAQARCRT